jgi:hypothetical protein
LWRICEELQPEFLYNRFLTCKTFIKTGEKHTTNLVSSSRDVRQRNSRGTKKATQALPRPWPLSAVFFSADSAPESEEEDGEEEGRVVADCRRCCSCCRPRCIEDAQQGDRWGGILRSLMPPHVLLLLLYCCGEEEVLFSALSTWTSLVEHIPTLRNVNHISSNTNGFWFPTLTHITQSHTPL